MDLVLLYQFYQNDTCFIEKRWRFDNQPTKIVEVGGVLLLRSFQ